MFEKQVQYLQIKYLHSSISDELIKYRIWISFYVQSMNISNVHYMFDSTRRHVLYRYCVGIQYSTVQFYFTVFFL
jgi:hypothetical protein